MKILESSLADMISKGLIEDKKYDLPPEFINIRAIVDPETGEVTPDITINIIS